MPTLHDQIILTDDEFKKVTAFITAMEMTWLNTIPDELRGFKKLVRFYAVIMEESGKKKQTKRRR